MTAIDYAASKAKSHTSYYVIGENGKKVRVPGVTTITGVMDKPALVKWANNLGLQGIDSTKYVDELADIGTLCHWLIEQHVKGVKIDQDMLKMHWTGSQIDLAENGYIKFMEWEDKHGFEMIGSELQLVSQNHWYGGTLDLYGVLKKDKDKRVLVDIKTSKGIFGEHKTQVAGGYGILAEENGHKCDEIVILRVGRTPDEGFEDKWLTPSICELHRKRFMVCRELYKINNEIRKVDGY